MSADADAVYDETVDIDLSSLVPLAAMPHMPDRVKPVTDIGPIKVDQVCIGSCTNSSLYDMKKVAAILRGHTVAPGVSLVIAPGSKQVLTMLAMDGSLADMIAAGARILESACGPCIGMGQSPCSGGISLRTFNRNFEGRSGTRDAGIYLVSPETAAVSALKGVLTDPRTLGEPLRVVMPVGFLINDNMIEMPAGEKEAKDVEVVYGPNIKKVPVGVRLPDSIKTTVLLKVGDNITTDHIMPAGDKILPYRSNVPYMSQFCFGVCDETFPQRAKEAGSGIITAGSNYGQGSSREHAALAPLYLGIKAVVAVSFARMHRSNLINSGILPLTFVNAGDYAKLSRDDQIELPDIRAAVSGHGDIVLRDLTTGESIPLCGGFSDRETALLLAGGMLNYIAESRKN